VQMYKRGGVSVKMCRFISCHVKLCKCKTNILKCSTLPCKSIQLLFGGQQVQGCGAQAFKICFSDEQG
jgi:hypothetical protein